MTAVASVPYRLKVRLGQHEFEAEGPESSVREQYEAFLQIAQIPAKNGSNGASHSGTNGSNPKPELDADVEAAWNRAYKRTDDSLSLHVLPTTKTQIADAVVLLLYGYQSLLRQDSVKSTDLMEAATQSGLRIDRIDRNLPRSHSAFIIKGGNGKGSRYSLNNRGLVYAQEMLDGLFE